MIIIDPTTDDHKVSVYVRISYTGADVSLDITNQETATTTNVIAVGITTDGMMEASFTYEFQKDRFYILWFKDPSGKTLNKSIAFVTDTPLDYDMTNFVAPTAKDGTWIVKH